MTQSLITIINFQKLIERDPDKINYSDENDKKVISKVVERVIEHLSNTNNPNDDELLSEFIEKITIINNKFSECGQNGIFSTSIEKLNSLSKQRLGTKNLGLFQDPFVSKLNSILKNEIENKAQVAEELYDFQNNKLIPALRSAQTQEDMDTLKEIVQHCYSLSKKLSSVKGNLEASANEIKALWKAKSIQTEKVYTSLISYEKGAIGHLNTESQREKKAGHLDEFVSNFIEHSSHPVFSQKDKALIFKAVSIIHTEFQQYQDERLYPILKKLHQSLGIPLPQEKPEVKVKPQVTGHSSEFEKLRAQWEQPSKSEPSSSTSSKAPKVKSKQSEEEIQRDVLQRLQTRLSSLDLESRDLKDNITAIESDIKKLKKLSSCQTLDFRPLEKVLELIKDPKALNVSSEESRFVELLLMDHLGVTPKELIAEQEGKTLTKGQKEKLKNLKAMHASYSDLQKTSVNTAQSAIVKALKKGAIDINVLLKSATQVTDGLREKVVNDRFNRFVEKNPSLAKFKLSNYFPALVNVFTEFTNNVARPELDQKWTEIAQLYDGETNGNFSQLLKHYSYMDPTRNFDAFIAGAQEDFFKSLNLKTPFSNSDLNPRLKQVMDQFKDYTTKYFEGNYMGMFSAMHLWLVGNYDRIEVPFNQGDDDDKNLGKGVCFANSLNRNKLLIDDPNLKVQMGSNEKTRFVQRKYGAQHELLILGKNTLDEVHNETAKEFGLKPYYNYLLPSQKEDVRHQDLVDQMETYALAGHTQFVLSLKSSKAGHALNIQIHIQKGIFRIMDDNIGSVKYASLTSFKKEVEEYFKSFYPEFDYYIFRLYTK
jgi:hypothetical protein